MFRLGAPALLTALFLVPAACAPPAEAPTRPLPTYVGRSTELFDDAIEPRAIGLDTDISANAKSDPLLRERVQIGDATLRVRIATITVKQEESDATYHIVFRVLDKLSGLHSPGDSFTVRVNKQSVSAGILKSYESQMIGKSFTAFVRLFVRSDGDQEMHFHLSPDAKDVLAAVRSASDLADFH